MLALSSVPFVSRSDLMRLCWPQARHAVFAFRSVINGDLPVISVMGEQGFLPFTLPLLPSFLSRTKGKVRLCIRLNEQSAHFRIRHEVNVPCVSEKSNRVQFRRFSCVG